MGSNKTVKVDIRIIAATHRELEEQVQSGRFREDLYYRLSVVRLALPPLRERPGDVEALATHFVRVFSAEFGKQLRLDESALAVLRAYDWPGNVRELRNVIERAAVLAGPIAVIDADEVIFDPRPHSSAPRLTGNVFDEIARTELQAITDALKQSKGSVAGAARLLGLPRTTLNDRLKKYDIR